MTTVHESDLLDVSRRDDLIFDIGMHQGEDTDFYLRKGFRVVGIEADPELARLCRARFERQLPEGKLTLIEGAVVTRPQDGYSAMVRFFRNRDKTDWGTVQPDWAARNRQLGTRVEVIEVPAVDLVEVIKSHGVPYYMKIDIEGADWVCLAALARFRQRPAYVSLESSKTSLAGIRSEIDVLTALGYDRFQAIEQSSLPAKQRPPSPAREGRYAPQSFPPGSSGLFGAELPGPWRTREQIMRQYRWIRLGYYLVGDTGIMWRWRIPGTSLARRAVRRILQAVTGAPVPGWYDTHARYGGHVSNSAGVLE